MASEFDAVDRIAGFPLANIQTAIFWAGVVGGRHHLKRVCNALGCGPRRAAEVLEELERQGFLTRGDESNPWSRTEKADRLAAWKPPRRFRPLIEREDRNNPGNQGIENVFCLLFETTQDDEEIFEEARLQVLFWPQYEGAHLVEVSVFQPENYDKPEANGTFTTSIYLAPADARAVAAALLKAADMTEAEIARRAKHPPKYDPIPIETRTNGGRASTGGRPTKATTAKDERRAEVEARKRAKEEARVAAVARRRARETVAATVAELRGAKVDRSRPAKRR